MELEFSVFENKWDSLGTLYKSMLLSINIISIISIWTKLNKSYI